MTREPAVLEITVKKADTYEKAFDDFEFIKAEKIEMMKAKKEAEAAEKAEKETEAKTEKVAMSVVELVVETS